MDRAAAVSLVSYQYDALDRLVGRLLAGQDRLDRFYLKDRIVTEIRGTVQRQIFQFQDVLLAELQTEGVQHASLVTTDIQRSVVRTTDSQSAYTPYGHRAVEGECPSLLGFNGERPDSYTEHYLLGNGHRAFNPKLMRFNSPDSLSPFGKGGLNCYAYCQGDPINRTDPTGRFYADAWFANASLGFVNDYMTPYLPKRPVQRIPGVGNKTFGEITKRMAQVSGLAASVLYLVMNRIEDAHPDSPANDPIFFAFLTTTAFGFLNGAGFTLHKLARRAPQPRLASLTRSPSLPNLPRSASAPSNSATPVHSSAPRPRSQSLSNTGHNFGDHIPTPVTNTNLDKFNLQMMFEQGKFRPDPIVAHSTSIRNGLR